MNAVVTAAEELSEVLDKVTIEENYLPEQIFDMDETSLFWKWIPERIFIHKEPSKCQVSRLLGIG